MRLSFAYVPNGIVMKDWAPKAVGQGYEFTRLLKPLAALREDLFVLTNLDSHTGNALGDGPGDHSLLICPTRIRLRRHCARQ